MIYFTIFRYYYDVEMGRISFLSLGISHFNETLKFQKYLSYAFFFIKIHKLSNPLEIDKNKNVYRFLISFGSLRLVDSCEST